MMETWTEKRPFIRATPYVPGMDLPLEMAALGARIVTEKDGSETLIGTSGAYPLTEGMLLTVMDGAAGANTAEKLERRWQRPAPAVPAPEPERAG